LAPEDSSSKTTSTAARVSASACTAIVWSSIEIRASPPAGRPIMDDLGIIPVR
jgi:hypothetical protein